MVYTKIPIVMQARARPPRPASCQYPSSYRSQIWNANVFPPTALPKISVTGSSFIIASQTRRKDAKTLGRMIGKAIFVNHFDEEAPNNRALSSNLGSSCSIELYKGPKLSAKNRSAYPMKRSAPLERSIEYPPVCFVINNVDCISAKANSTPGRALAI